MRQVARLGPGLSRPSTSFSPPESKTWMPRTSARSKASSPRPGMTEKVQEIRLCAQPVIRRARLGEAVIRRRNKMADYALAHPPYALPLLPFLRDEAGSSSWPGISAKQSFIASPGHDGEVQEIGPCAQAASRRSPGGA